MTRIYYPPQPEQPQMPEANVDFAPDETGEPYAAADMPYDALDQSSYGEPYQQGYFPEGFDAYAEDAYDDVDAPYAPTAEIYMDDAEFLTDEERAILRHNRWQMLANLWDFLGVIAGTALILVLMALLISLLNWLGSDIRQTFTLWQTKM